MATTHVSEVRADMPSGMVPFRELPDRARYLHPGRHIHTPGYRQVPSHPTHSTHASAISVHLSMCTVYNLPRVSNGELHKAAGRTYTHAILEVPAQKPVQRRGHVLHIPATDITLHPKPRVPQGAGAALKPVGAVGPVAASCRMIQVSESGKLVRGGSGERGDSLGRSP